MPAFAVTMALGMHAFNLPTELLRTFVTVADLGGYTRAAAALGRTQPAISLQMRRLEKIVGATLITRHGRGFRLSEDGETLSLYAREILRLNDEAVARFRGADAAGIIRIGLPTDFAVAYLQDMLTAFTHEHADVQLEVRCDLSRALLDALHRDELDIAVALTGPHDSRYLVRTWQEQPIWVTADGAGIERRSPLPLVAHPEGCEYRNRMVHALNGAGLAWRIAFTSPGISGLQKAVLDGLGVSALTRKTLLEGMRVLGPVDGFPPLAVIQVGLCYKHPRLTDAGLMLVNRFVHALDEAACSGA